MAAKRRDLGSLSARMQALQAKVNPVAPYEITDTLSIRQTRIRRDSLHEAYLDIETGKRRLLELNRQANELPEPTPLAEGADQDAIDAYVGALGAWRAQVDHMNTVAEQVVEKINEAGTRYERAFWGDAYDEIMELSADWDAGFFDAFRADVTEHFMAKVNVPPDGTDETGEIVDVVEAVEAGKLPT